MILAESVQNPNIHHEKCLCIMRKSTVLVTVVQVVESLDCMQHSLSIVETNARDSARTNAYRISYGPCCVPDDPSSSSCAGIALAGPFSAGSTSFGLGSLLVPRLLVLCLIFLVSPSHPPCATIRSCTSVSTHNLQYMPCSPTPCLPPQRSQRTHLSPVP